MGSQTITRSQARRIALAAQGFTSRRANQKSNWTAQRNAIALMGLLQMDSINTVIRSHYMPLYSRLGAYDRAALDKRAFRARGRELFEYWAHEASLLPFDFYPLLRWRMRKAREGSGIYGQCHRLWRERPHYVKDVLDQIRTRGPLRSRAFNDGGGGKGMWDWHDGKVALEFLFWTGEITTHSRDGFQRIYDLTERVLPAEVMDQPMPDEADAQRRLLMFSASALGVATASDLRDYFRLSAAEANARIAELAENGDLEPVTVEGWKETAYLAKDHTLPRWIRTSTVLTPFDPVVWERKRTERLFDFRYRIEIYVPAEKRQYGYYVLPVLLDERLAARLDLKCDRSEGVLNVLGAYMEKGQSSPEVCERTATELVGFADWLGVERVVVQPRGDMAEGLANEIARQT